MATNYLVLGQVAPSATTSTTLYTAPASTQAVISTIFVCNRGSTTTNFRISVRPNGAALSNQHYLYYDTPLEGNTTIGITAGITLGDTDVVTVYADSASFTFSAFGSEVTSE